MTDIIAVGPGVTIHWPWHSFPHSAKVEQETIERYISRYAEYRDSWKSASMDFLIQRLRGELREFENSGYDSSEAIDVYLIAKMLAVRAEKKMLAELKETGKQACEGGASE